MKKKKIVIFFDFRLNPDSDPDREPDPDLLFPEVDPWIWILIYLKMKWIRITACYCSNYVWT